MSDKEPKRDLTTEEARAGRTPGIVRWVLLASLILVVIGFIVARLVA